MDDAEKLGNLLIEEGLVTQEELEQAAGDASVTASGLGSALKNASCVSRAELAAFVGTDYNVIQIPDPGSLKINSDALGVIGGNFAQENQVIPVARTADILFALAAAPSMELAKELRKSAGLKVKLLQANPAAVKALVNARYGGAPAVSAEDATVVDTATVQAKPAGKAVAVQATQEEKAAVELFMKLVSEWEQTYTEARAVAAIKVA